MSRFALFAAVLLLALGGCKTDEPGGNGADTVRLDIERFRVDLGPDDHTLGGEAPLVTVVVFSDYACAPCARLWKVIDNLLEDYGDEVRVVFRSMTVPGFTRGEEAIEAAYVAGRQQKFWEMHRRLFAEQSGFERPVIRAHAEALGLDVDRFMNDLDTGAESGRRLRDKRQAKALGVLAAPVAFVNGVPMVGYKDETVWHALLDEEIRRARQMIREGVPRAKVYETLMAGATTRPLSDVKEIEALKQRLEQAADPAAPSIPPSADARYRIPLEGSPVRGPDDAPVLIVEFLDFQCPICRKSWEESVPKVLEKFGNDVKLAIIHLPLEIHTAAKGAAKASIAAQRQGKFWEFHDRLLVHETSWGRDEFTKIARELGLDVDRFVGDLDDPAVDKVVAGNLDLARRLGVQATPTFFVNGRHIKGFQPENAMTAIVEGELVKAKAVLKAGVPRDKLAEALFEGALGEDQYPNR